MAVDARFRREWRKKNPILGKNVMGIDLNDNSVKLGDGETRWNDLVYTSQLPSPSGVMLPSSSGDGTTGGVGSAELDSAVADLNASIATRQASATAATDTELNAAVANLNALVAAKQDAVTAATDSELNAAIANLTALITPKQDAASAATDAELASQVSTLTALINAKQDNATAATDAELAAAIADVNASISAKQDAATAATDSELAAAVSNLNATLLTKQDAATAATDAELAAAFPVMGTLAARPTAAAFGRGYYWASDDNGGTLYYSNATAWTKMSPGVAEPAGLELGYAEITAAPPGVTGGAVDIVGLSTTVTVGTRPIVVKVTADSGQNTVAGAGLQLTIMEGASQKQARTAMSPAANQIAGIGTFQARLTPSPGQHTYKVQIASVFAGTSTLNVTPTNPVSIQVVTC